MDTKSSLVNQTVLDAEEIAIETIEDVLDATFITLNSKAYKLKCTAMYQEILSLALKDVVEIYDKKKPRTDHSSIIEDWQRDKPAKPSKPDSLMKYLL